MKLILIRHGESEANIGASEITGTNKLTEKGIKQAKELGKKLLNEKIDAIFCSPTDRCQETMEEIISQIDGHLPIHFSKLLGPKRKIETISQVKIRIDRFIDDLKCEFENDETILVITHQVPIRMFSYILRGEDLITENGSMNILEFENDGCNH